MCNPSASTVDYTAEPEEITQLRNQAASASAGCCHCACSWSGTFESTGKLLQLALDGVTPNGEKDRSWTGEVYVASDGTRGTVTVYHRLKAVNRTGDTTGRYPETIPMTNEDVAKRVAKIPAAIEKAWNDKPYQLKITDEICGERLFDVRFHVRMVESGEHYTLDFVNVPGMGTRDDAEGVGSGRSYILPPNRGKFNLGEGRTATDNNPFENVLEPHEFGHMIGLIDEYLDTEYERNGVRYEFPNGTTETAGVNEELMGRMTHKTARPSRYCVTIAYAAIKVLELHNYPVSRCEIL
jgi:hypothetical protein